MKLKKMMGLGTMSVGVATALVAATAGSAAASPTPPSWQIIKTISSAFVGPLQFAVDGHNVVVADNFTSTLSIVGHPTPLAVGPDPSTGGDIGGVAVDPDTHQVAYTTSNGDHSYTTLTIVHAGGKNLTVNLAAFEKKYNPDQINHYGDIHTTNACVLNALNAAGATLNYTGLVDSHPYAVAALGHGAFAVADAGGNDLLKVDASGHISVLSVLPPQPEKVTAALAAANGLPSCVVGITYVAEPVPTDVEVGPHGQLFVTTLPGGIDGAFGSVYAIGAHGSATKIAGGLESATNLAIDPVGHIYVAELGSGQIAEIVNGKPYPVISLPDVAAVEWANGHLYASTAPAANGGTAPGTIVELGCSTTTVD
ncbi:MAG TPA: ScyD/ScyE family protein [Acidothermaceae bacterium]|jgi:hypothetical protein